MSLRFFDVGPGGPAEVFWHQSRIFLPHAVVSEAAACVQVYVYEATGARIAGAIWPASRGSWPCGRSALGTWWLLYRDEDERATLRRDGQVVWRSPERCGGNHCVALGSLAGRDVLAWQRDGDNALFVVLLEALPSTPGETPSEAAGTQVGLGAADGISHVNELDGLRLWKDNFGSVPGMTAPSRAGLLTEGEHPDAGVLVQYYDRQLLVWPAAITYTPRLAVDRGTYAVTTWNRAGVLLATFTIDDLVVPAQAPTESWDDVGTEVDCRPFFDIQGSTIPRAVSPAGGGEWQAHRIGSQVRIVKFGQADHVEILDTSRADIRLLYDSTDGKTPRAWRVDVIGDGQHGVVWMPSRMRVGDRVRVPDATLIRRDANGGPSTRGDFPYAYGLIRHGRHVDMGGTLGVVDEVLVTRWEPMADRAPDGYYEAHWWAITGGRAIGLVRYDEIRNGATDASNACNYVLPQAHIDPAQLVVYPIPDPPADAQTPVPTPEVPVKIWAYNDTDAVRVIDFLELKYLTPTEQGGLGRDKVDNLGYARWLHDAVRLLDGGWTVDRVLLEINKRINQIVGLPLDAWPGGGPVTPPVPDQPVPSASRLVGPLRIASDKSAFIDDTGPVLPVLCHLGDGLSRWTRDPGGVSALLDDIAAAGYDGVRTWTVLGGSSYWNGREVGPMYQGNYFDHVSAFAAALRARGLRWLVSQGDAMRLLPSTPERQAFMRSLAERLDLELVAGVDAGNELLWNGETDPARMRAAVDAFRGVLPCAVWSLTSPGSEEKADLDTFSGSVFDVHGYRDARSWDKVRHIFSIGYEGKPSARLGIQSEPFGYGDLVSASANKDELTSGVLALACAVSLLSRQAWVYFSGPGVKSDAGQRLQDMPGFRETPQLRAWLPRDLMAFQTITHGGASKRGTRVFAVPGTDETRADGVIHNDGRWVWALYGPRWRECALERASDIVSEFSCGEAGKLVQGRLR